MPLFQAKVEVGMISEQTKNKVINRPPPSPEVIDKLNKSEQEAEGLVLRNIKCPSCNFVVGKVFSDATGHIRIKCPKCKLDRTINLLYFCRLEGFGKLKQNLFDELED